MNSPSFVEQQAIDLSVCDREPIRIPGSIQPHGFLVRTSVDNIVVLQVSDNLQSFTGRTVEESLGQSLASLIGEASCRHLLEAIDAHNIEGRATYLGTVSLPNGGFFDALAHSAGGMVTFEFEPVSRQAHADFRHLYPLVGSFLGKLNDVETVDAMSDVAVGEIKTVTGFGRILLYRFDEHGHGHVIAEAKDNGYPSYLGQRFPASDVPRQARELYLANRIRLIADANYTPSKLLPAQDPVTGGDTDLTYSALRSVSPVHLRYLKNMGTLASMSISLVINGRLWGLISCHNADPKAVPFELREACEQLGQILALRIQSVEDATEYRARLELRRILVSMLGTLSQGEDLFGNMEKVSPDLLRFASAGGAALIFEGQIHCCGETPNEQQIQDLVQWLSVHSSDDVFQTESLASVYPEGESIKHLASGVLALPISRIHRHYLIWFRPEVIQTIDWAGNPHLKADPSGHLNPRKSFDIWHETVTGTSRPWRASEIEIATEFRTAMLGIVLERAEQMAVLADELGRANKELEAFSYSVSHDLRAPMRHIVGYTDLLIEFDGEKLGERSHRFLNNIKESARFAGKLVDDLLSFSQMGRAALRIGTVDMSDIVNAAIEKLSESLGERTVQWKIDPLPAIQGDPAFLQPAIYNLLENAVKYTRNQPEAIIAMRIEQTEDEHIVHVCDNGVGFDMDYVHKLFGVFQRLHRIEEFEGTGIGLANVRRIIERHGGRVWANGKPGEGAEFSFAIPKQITLEDGE